jgi:Arf-GAP/SH3 domain/ANK repeat/PH domain-containing protein
LPASILYSIYNFPATGANGACAVSMSSVVISSPRKRTSVNIVPNAFPATRISASRPLGDHYPLEYVQDAEVPTSAGGPAFILKLSNDDELVFTFTFVIRQSQQTLASPSDSAEPLPLADTQINGLTYVYASTPREVENLVTREFQADPNLHKNNNVELVGDYSTGGSPSVTFEWSWKWKPPKNTEDKGGGWRNSCSVRGPTVDVVVSCHGQVADIPLLVR